LREAAMNEDDPELREKLWEEYRVYKTGKRSTAGSPDAKPADEAEQTDEGQDPSEEQTGDDEQTPQSEPQDPAEGRPDQDPRG
jgi:hypothetical protein